MRFKKIAVLTSKQSWFVPYAQRFIRQLRQAGFSSRFFDRHENISEQYEVVLILSYFRIIPGEYLLRHRHNIVVHESDLPRGTGWAPLFWQILEGKNKIPFVLFEAGEKADSGALYLKSSLQLRGNELYEDIRRAQALKTIEMCMKFSKNFNHLRPQKQKGRRTFFRKRTPADSELDIEKSIRSQFRLLRIVSNEDFPAFFRFRGEKYTIKIYKKGPYDKREN